MYRLSDIEAYIEQRRVAAAGRLIPKITMPLGYKMEEFPITDQQWEFAKKVIPIKKQCGARAFINLLLKASQTGAGLMSVSGTENKTAVNLSRLSRWNNSGLLFHVMEAMSKDKDFAKTYSFVGKLCILCSIDTRRYGSNGLEVAVTTLTGNAKINRLRTGRRISNAFSRSNNHSFTEDNRTSGSDDSSGRD